MRSSMTFKATDNQYGRLSLRQLGFLLIFDAVELPTTFVCDVGPMDDTALLRQQSRLYYVHNSANKQASYHFHSRFK